MANSEYVIDDSIQCQLGFGINAPKFQCENASRNGDFKICEFVLGGHQKMTCFAGFFIRQQKQKKQSRNSHYNKCFEPRNFINSYYVFKTP